MMPQEQTYTPVDGDEHGSALDDASTDADEVTNPLSAAGLDKSWEEFGTAPRRRASRWATCCSSVVLQGLLNTVLLVVVLALLADRRWHQDRVGQFQSGGDMTGFIPPVSQQIKTFVPDWGFSPENASEFFTDAVKHKWLSIVPSTCGPLLACLWPVAALTVAQRVWDTYTSRNRPSTTISRTHSRVMRTLALSSPQA